MKKFRPVLLIFLSVFLAPLLAYAASASFTEIMYDLSGTDTGREWIEIKNTDSAEVSFVKWKLFEANTNHGLTLHQGNATTSAGGFAIIADDPTKFLTDNPSYSGTLFKSSFSLLNTGGETLELKLDNVSVAQTTYASSAGAGGDGNTLHYVSNSWQASAPTPGTESGTQSSTPQGGSASTTPDTATTTPASEEDDTAPPPVAQTPTGSTWVYKPQIYVAALVPQKGTAGAPVLFDAAAVGAKKEPLPNAHYLWNFGDGGVAEGKKVYHTYHYPAVYTVMVDASSGEYSTTDRKDLVITAPELVILNIKEGDNGFIELQNNGKSEVDLSLWLLKSGAGTFTLPQGTLIGARKSIPFAAAITNLSADALSTVLLYPNGMPVTVYAQKVENTEPAVVKAEPPVVTLAVAEAPKVKEPLPEKPKTEPVQEVKKEKVPAVAEPVSVIASSTELMGAIGASGGGSSLPWLLGVTALVVLSIGGYTLMLRPKSESSAADELRKEAATFDIIE